MDTPTVSLASTPLLYPCHGHPYRTLVIDTPTVPLAWTFNTDINICVWEYITNLQISVKSPALTQSHIMINIFDIV